MTTSGTVVTPAESNSTWPRLRGLKRRWVMSSWARSCADADAQWRVPLSQRILAARGLTDRVAAEQFCHPRLTDLADPGLLPQIDRAVERIIDALRRDERIAIYGDYDVDGMTATAILFHLIRAIRPDAALVTYVPHRLEEGYGLNAEALRQLRPDGVDLVISVDCGITAVEPARVAREIGLDLIITDHHHAAGRTAQPLPDALAIVHPASARERVSLRRTVRCGRRLQARLALRHRVVRLGAGRPGAAAHAARPAAAGGAGHDRRRRAARGRESDHRELRSALDQEVAARRSASADRGVGLAAEDIDSEKVGFGSLRA